MIEDLNQNSIKYETEKTYTIVLNRQKIGTKRLDLVIEDSVIVEIKAVRGYIPDILRQQLISYLKVTTINVGLLVNFGNTRCTVNRILNDQPIRVIR